MVGKVGVANNGASVMAADDGNFSATQLHLWRADTVRARCHEILELARQDKLVAYRYFPEKLPEVADYVVQVMQARYPDWNIPPHSRWRHFSVGEVDRWQQLVAGVSDPKELQYRATELTIVSVLLDAGAGARWQYKDAHDSQCYQRSEGLALASLELYAQGAFSSRGRACEVDGTGLSGLSLAALETGFQVRDDNPLIGTQGRLALLHQLGEVINSCPAIFSKSRRLGCLVDFFLASDANLETDNLETNTQDISVEVVFQELLKIFSIIWPQRGDHSFGDVWAYAGVGGSEPGAGFVPFHKLTQWMTYSLVEAWNLNGLKTRDEDCLTALAEYRNGGLLLDMGVLKPRATNFSEREFAPSDYEVVELRAMTVAIIDKLLIMINERLVGRHLTLTLAQVLEGGTWAAGRKLAFERSPEGSPPIKYAADGTLF
ncbi:phospho-2-dehydro-3-deoxyheptonate aldolase [Oleiphilus messinensis]|uniref:Phospho-2-dehydro-3-deoxyheptonate aldolase n=1 Tax=Oleiphilus messinensis TaxID=141451 RepID=A0A1Y0I250_9GAMM|nr:DUF1688 family protein [Oleiphilus messinensis]ARU54547.1 phospho-2-dehydro-3-deoxyheptonate aldolase [Oleiphilus messinensis]